MFPHPGPWKTRLAKKMMNFHGRRDENNAQGDDDAREDSNGGEDTAGRRSAADPWEQGEDVYSLPHLKNLVVMVLTTRARLHATLRSSMTVWSDGPSGCLSSKFCGKD